MAPIPISSLITEQIPEYIRSGRPVTPLIVNRWRKIADKEFPKASLAHLSLNPAVYTDDRYRPMINHYQGALVILLDHVYNDRSQAKEELLTDLYDDLSKRLEILLADIRTCCPFSFNMDGRLPLSQFERTRIFVSARWDAFYSALMSLGIPRTLLISATSPIWRFTDTKRPDDISFRIHDYTLILMERMAAWLNEEHAVPEKSFIHLLIELNLNTAFLRGYITTDLKKQLDRIDTIAEKLDLLDGFKDEISLVPMCRNMAFTAQYEPLKDSLLAWMVSEEKLLRKQLPADAASKEALPPGVKKLKTSLTREELANLFVGLMELGIIEADSKIDMFRTVAACFESKRQEGLSVNGLKGHYKTISAKSLEVLMDIAMDLFNLFKKK